MGQRQIETAIEAKCENISQGGSGLPDLLKHSAAIHISNTLTESERKTYNVMLLLARSSLKRGVDHVVDIRTIEDALGQTSSSRKHLVRTIYGLRGREVRYNIFGKDRDNATIWNMAAGVLADVGFNEDFTRCRYSFPNSLIDLLASPSVYARINLAVQRQLSGQHTLALYEFYIDQLGAHRRTATIRLRERDLRTLLALEDKFSDFRVLKRDVLNKSHARINAKSDLLVEIVRSTGREEKLLEIVLKKTIAIPQLESQWHAGGNLEADILELTNGNTRLVKTLFTRYEPERIARNLAYTKAMIANRPGEEINASGYLNAATEQDYAGGQDRGNAGTKTGEDGRQSSNADRKPRPAASALVDEPQCDLLEAMPSGEFDAWCEAFEASRAYATMCSMFPGSKDRDSRIFRSHLALFIKDDMADKGS